MIDVKDREEALRYLKVVEDMIFEMADQYSYAEMDEQAEGLYEAFCDVNQVRMYVDLSNGHEEYEERFKEE